jgi:RNA polymerase sigma-70 factor, ECF subfamily
MNSGDPSEHPAPPGRNNSRDRVTPTASDDHELSDEQLLAAFVGGDGEGFSALVVRYARELHPFILRYVRDSALAEDVIQETFLQVHESAGSFDASRRFRPWLFTIAVNKARDHLRGRTRKREVPLAVQSGGADSETASYLDFLSDPEAAPQLRLDSVELQEVVRGIISEMPDHLREVLVMGYYERFPYKDMAEILDIPLGTVKSRLHAAVSHFAAQFRKTAGRTGFGQDE